MPSPEQARTIKTHFEIMSVPYNIVRADYSRGARASGSTTFGRQKTQRSATMKNHDSVVLQNVVHAKG